MMLSGAAPIPDLDALRVHLQFAIGLELTTIPPYLCALYSIPDGENAEAVTAIQSVVVEEMLHMTFVANILNAIGGAPSPEPVAGIGSPVPRYPTKVPFIHRLPEIHLLPFSPEAVDAFVAIEQPAEGTEVHDDGYDSIGQFYAAIEAGLSAHATEAVFAEARTTRAGCQVPSELFYGGASALFEVSDLDGALVAVREIVRQGEGVPPAILGQHVAQHLMATTGARASGDPVIDGDVVGYGWVMYSHYARFKEIQAGRHYRPSQSVGEDPAGDVLPVDWTAALPMAADPDPDAVDGAYSVAMRRFDERYSGLVDTLYRAFNGEPKVLEMAVGAMFQLKYEAIALMRTPSPVDLHHTLGPPFRYRT